MTGKFKLLYSETSRGQIMKLHPHLKPVIKARIEEISEQPYTGKFLERELSGYLSIRAKRYRIIYKIAEEDRTIQIHYVGHRKDIYELFGEQMRKDRMSEDRSQRPEKTKTKAYLTPVPPPAGRVRDKKI